MASASSSSGSVPNAPRKYDVFISFRGEDTRNNFTSHLHAALNRASLEVFHDDKKLEKGHEIAQSLALAIKNSSVYVIVFSEDYASSKWCLDELHQIMQYRKDEGQFVIPIFYKVDPRDVRNQIGAYKKAFEKHEIDYQHDPDRVKRWRAALSEAGKLKGMHCQTFMDESKLIEEIVAHVSTKLEGIYNCHGTSKDVIGIDEMIKPIEELLEKSHKVGIWGIGGVGKTTMAKVVFDNLSSQYSHRYFLENVREKTGKKGLEDVRDSLVSKLLGKDTKVDSSNEAFVVGKLGKTKAFVVLDDVVTTEQLEKLLDNTCNFLQEGSKVIITTRDQDLLGGKGYEIHKAKGLSDENSRRLFICKAFGSDNAKDGYEELIEGFVDYAKQNPLALKVLGSLVRPKHKEYWGELLKDLRAGNPHDEIQKVLKLSYDRLHPKAKQIFLEIACFLKGESEEFVKELLESYDFYLHTGMQTLKDKALIDTTSGKVEMHDLVQEMGRRIVCEEDMDPGKRSRLWRPREICDILKNCEGEKEVEGIMLKTIENIELTDKTFNKMTRLRFLKVYSPWAWMSDVKSSPSSLESISTRMRHFHWEGYPMKSLPSNFCAKHLLELNLAFGKVETLWEGVQDLPNLRRLNLRYCTNLRKLPDFSKACRLESVDLNGCENLYYVHESLLSHRSLISLDLSNCISLKSITSRGLESISTRIRYFHWRGYPMKSLPSSFCVKHLVELDLGDSLVEILWEGVQDLANLRRLKLERCRNLRELPDFSKACRLESVDLNGCWSLCYVHESLLSLHSLISLDLSGCISLKSIPARGLESIFIRIRYFHWSGYPMKSLPSNFCVEHLVELILQASLVETLWEGVQDLPNLRGLNLKHCYNLRELPDFSKACMLESVCLSGCRSLCYVHESLLSLHSLIHLDVSLCVQLKSLQNRIHLKSLEEVDIAWCKNLKEFSVSSEELRSLKLYYTKLEELGPSIGLCSKLRKLYLVGCKNLTGLPDSITQLSSLEELHFTQCPNLTKVPDNMRLLSKLQCLSVQCCTALHSLPELPPSLRTLIATDCTSLETVSPSTISSTPQNKGEKLFSFTNCVKLDWGAIEEQVKLLLEKAVHEKENVIVDYPGKKVPEWFGNNRTQNDSDTLKLCLSSHTLVGFVFCAVAPDFLQKEFYGFSGITFSVEEDEMTRIVVKFPELIDFKPGNVLLCSNPIASEWFLKKIEGNRRNHDATTYNPNLSFEFGFFYYFCGPPVKKAWGVYPIYASGNSELNSNSRKRKA